MSVPCALLLLAIATTPGDVRLPEYYESVARCDAMRAADAAALEPYQCYWSVAGHRGQQAEALSRLEQLREDEPANPRVALYLGLVIANHEGLRAEGLFREAIAGFEAEGTADGAVFALISLALNLQWQQRGEEAPPLIRRAMDWARRSGKVDLENFVLVHEAQAAGNRHEHGKAWSLYRHIDGQMGPETSFFVRAGTLGGLAYTSWAMGRYREALDTYRRLADLRRRAQMPRAVASDLFNIALLAGLLQEEGSMSRRDVEVLTKEAVEAARQADHRALEAKARLNLAEMPWVDRGERLAQIEAALRLTAETGDAATRSFALRLLAREKAAGPESEQAGAPALAVEALLLARDLGDLDQEARGLRTQAIVLWELGREEEAMAAALDALDAIERIRDLQRDETVRAGWFGRHAYFYDLTIVHLLEAAEEADDEAADPGRLDLAFRILERKRARTLLDRLDAAGAQVPAAESQAAAGRRRVLAELDGVLKQLPRPDLDRRQRDQLLARLAALESEERRLRQELSRQDPAFAGLRAASVPALAEVMSGLEPDEALLSYILPAEGNGSWALVLTRDAVRAYPMPQRPDLARRIRIYMGLLERRDGLADAASVRLFEDLLRAPLAGLSPEVDRLLIVPDQELHRLPIEALRPAAGEPTLGERYQVARIPSATIWLRWRRQPLPGTPHPGPVLALADPGMPDRAAEQEAWLRLSDRIELGALPHAREEAAAAVASLGGSVRTGAEASEHWLKTVDLDPYSLLHFATHVVLDEARPENSIVLLAPGPGEEDGLLSLREIVDLDLGGQAVILSACSSAGGALLQGEGPMGPARAFFQAEARAVVGSLWPLRDDEAEALITTLYRHLAAGLHLSAALRETRRELAAGGAATAAWAGLVLIGDGDLAFGPSVPEPKAVDPRAVGALGIFAAVALSAAALLALLALLTRRR